MFAPIDNPSIYIKPSDNLSKYIKSLNRENAPYGIKDFTSKRPSDITRKTIDHDLLLNKKDFECLKVLSEESGGTTKEKENLGRENSEGKSSEKKSSERNSSETKTSETKTSESKTSETKTSESKTPETKTPEKQSSEKDSKYKSDDGSKTHQSTKLVNMEDLHWVYERLIEENQGASEKVFFHELFKGSEIILPKNIEIDRNPELEKRCQVLKTQQDNLRYKAMTKNVDNVRKRLPEDTIAYQLKQINRHLIAIFQFIMSVVAGFAFGFIGIELLTGNLDFGFRLLLGIICSLVIALAELYFLAKKLNEELVIETKVEEQSKSKIN